MSRWINTELFDSFRKEKMEEKEAPSSNMMRSELVWQNPEMGTIDKAKVYEGRFVPDPKGQFYKKYYYHFWKSGEQWKFALCTKTHDFHNYCPFCSVVSKLYKGTKQDKAQGYLLKRKERFVGNFYIAKDNRDEDRDEEKKVIGKIKLYEFPAQLEKKLKKEITDKDQGYGYQIFDPGENGRNLIINVLATKPDKDGKQWPDYTSSDFSRRQSALGDESEIEALMATCTDLVEYIKSMESEKDEVVELLKNEFLWELVEDEAPKKGYVDDGSEPVTRRERPQEENVSESEDGESEEAQDEPEDEIDDLEQSQEVGSDDDLDDDALLRELDEL